MTSTKARLQSPAVPMKTWLLVVDVMSAHDSQFARFTNVFLYFFLSLSGLSNQIGFFFLPPR